MTLRLATVNKRSANENERSERCNLTALIHGQKILMPLIIWNNILSFLILVYLPLITNIPHLTNLDADLNMPMDQNFNYYSVNDFHGSHEINECSSDKKTFSALNSNIRSLTANYDKLIKIEFSIFSNWTFRNKI